jgi:hypothetical protein
MLSISIQALLAIEQLSTVPFLVLGNKIDDPNAVSEEVLRQQLGLYQTTGKVNQYLVNSLLMLDLVG